MIFMEGAWRIAKNHLGSALFSGPGLRVVYWTVITTHPRAEIKALQHLDQQGFECYAPRFRIIRVHKGRRLKVVQFLFPRYIFVQVLDQWRSVSNTFGVSSVLLSGNQPARVPSPWIEDIKARERNGVVVLPIERFSRGEKVKIRRGLWQGYAGIYRGMSSRQREIVLLSHLGSIELNPGDLDD